MRKLFIFAAVLLILSNFGLAQVPGQMNIMANGGLIQPFGPEEFNGGWKWGASAGAGFGYNVTSNIMIAILGDFNYFLFDTYGYTQNRNWTGENVNISGDPATVFSATGNILYRLIEFEDNNSLYALAGAGLMIRDRKDVVIRQFNLEEREFVIIAREEGFTDSGAMLQAGVGYDFVSTPRRSFYMELRYGIGFISDATTHYGSFKVGLRFSN